MAVNARWCKVDKEGKLLIIGWTRKQMKSLSLVNIPMAIRSMYGVFWNTQNDKEELFQLDFKKGLFYCYVALSTMFKAIDYYYKISLVIGKFEIVIYPDTFRYAVMNNHCVQTRGAMIKESVCIDGNGILEMKMNKFAKISMQNSNIHKVSKLDTYYEKVGYSRDGAPITNDQDEKLFWKCEERRVLRCMVTVTRDISPRKKGQIAKSSVCISIFCRQGILCLVYFELF